MKFPKVWSSAELTVDVSAARGIFRTERVGEPLDLYKDYYSIFQAVFSSLVPTLNTALKTNPVVPAQVAALVNSKHKLKALRYLCAPPISEDDLKSVADVSSVAPTVIAGDLDSATKIRDTILSVLDPFRFPWILAGKAPTQREIDSAVMASTAMAAAREVETIRRNTSKDAQEKAVKDMLSAMGWIEVPVRNIPILTAAPSPGEFCGECAVAGTRADIVVRLNDGRVLLIECKVSNSSVNSYKRVVHDAGGKAQHWYNQLGKAQVVPAAVLSGVFSTANLVKVQADNGLYIYWQHRLDDLNDYVKSVS